MQPIAQGLCRWRARNSSRIILNLSSRSAHCDTGDTVGYSEPFICVGRSAFTHDSFLPIIVPGRSPTTPGPHDGWPKEDTL
jgi:hypothetical protein